MVRRPLLPRWRYWPAMPLVALVGLIVVGLSIDLQRPKSGVADDRREHAQPERAANPVPDEQLAYYTEWLAGFTGVLALTSFLQGIFLFRADATARIAANAAARSADIASDTARKQLRAYVYVDTARVYNLDKAANRFIVVETKNFGSTPALNNRFWGGEHVREWPLTSQLGAPPSNMRMGVEALPPGRKSIFRVPVDELSEWEERELRDGRAGVYFWGRITYDDVNGGSHSTDIRLVCEGEGLNSGLMHATETGNESD